jgi:hypothetical protein
VLTNAIDAIRQDKWCRDNQNLNGQYCALGLINYACGLHYHSDNDVKNAAFEILDMAIPKDEFEQLRIRAHNSPYYKENGGTYRGNYRDKTRIASYNNTRPTEREVIAWFQDAVDLLSEIPVEA